MGAGGGGGRFFLMNYEGIKSPLSSPQNRFGINLTDHADKPCS